MIINIVCVAKVFSIDDVLEAGYQTYIVNNLGTMDRTTNDTEEESEGEDERELIYPEGEKYHFLVRRNFHATPSPKYLHQRENIFQTKCRIEGHLSDLIIDGGSESN